VLKKSNDHGDVSPTFQACSIVVECDSDAIHKSITQTSSSHLTSLVNTALATYRKNVKEEDIVPPNQSSVGKKASRRSEEDVTETKKYQIERKEKIRQRLEEVKAQVAEGQRRVEALKKGQNPDMLSGNHDKSEDNDQEQQPLRELLLQEPKPIPPTPLSTPQPSLRKMTNNARPATSLDSLQTVSTKNVEVIKRRTDLTLNPSKEAGTALEWNYYAREPSTHTRLSVETADDEDGHRLINCIRQTEKDEDVISLGASELNLKYDSILDMRNLSADINDPADDEDSENDALLPLAPRKKTSWVRDISEVVDCELNLEHETITSDSNRKLPQPDEEEPRSFSSRTTESQDTRSTVEPGQNLFVTARDSLHKRSDVSIPTESVLFQDISDTKLRRSALKLFKRLNPHDPWDINHRYNDDEVFEFIEEHPEVVAVKYDFEHFSGQIFPLSVLCTLGASLETIQLVYRFFPKAIEESDVWIGTPLHYAVQHKAKSSVVGFLISQHPFMLQARNQFGRLPLHMACLFRAHSKTIALLLEEYPEASDEVEKDGYTPLHLACENGSNAETIKLLIGGKPQRCVSRILSSGSTPLHLACGKNASKAVISELLSVGIDALGCLDAQGFAPLHLAIKHQASWDVIQCIVDTKPESVDMKTCQGYTVLSLAKKSDAPPGVLKLLTADG
jgi:ankyrin repeat protein